MFATARKILLLVLGIPFVILGTRFLLDAGKSAYVYWSAASWYPRDAGVLGVDLFSSDDQALGNQTVARYRYEFRGSTYDGLFSCIGDECPENLHADLKAAQQENRTVTTLVNPGRPDQSVLFRHLHVPLLLLKVGAGLFCFFTGSVAVIFGVYLLRGRPAGEKS